MSAAAPKIDARTAADVSAQLAGTPGKPGLLERYTAQSPFDSWHEYDPVTFAPLGRSAALIGIFARFSEIVIERLNRVPEKNFLAFLDLIGAARRPPQPARVPLTFVLSAGSAVDAQVPAGTQVAAPPPPGEKDPVVFETERPLVVTAAQLSSLVTLDPTQDTYGDWSERLAAPSAFAVFQGHRALEHVLYIGDSTLLGYARIKNLQLGFTLEESSSTDADARRGPHDARQVCWERWDGMRWQPLAPVVDSTDNLSQGGTVDFGEVQPLPKTTINSRASRWLRCRLLTPITRSSLAMAGMVREDQLPKVTSIIVAVDLERTLANGIVPDLGFANAAPLDLTKEFFPFGEKPKPYDTLFLASLEAFSKDRAANNALESARVQLDVQLANPLGEDPGSVLPSLDLVLAWDCWNGSAWQELGRSGPDGTIAGEPPFSDDTRGLTKSGIVTLRLPGTVAKTAVNGQENFWLRVRPVKGNYGKEASYALKDPARTDEGFTLVPASFRPPIIAAIKIGYELTSRRSPDVCFAFNQLAFADCMQAAGGEGGAFAPFVAAAEAERPGLYFGFSLLPGRAVFPNATISLYSRVAESRYGERAVPLSPETSARIGEAGSTVTHSFTITNASVQQEDFAIAVLGYLWPTTAVASVPVAASATYELAVKVDVPAGTQLGDSDGGFLRVSMRSEPDQIHGAAFTTGVGTLQSAEPPAVGWQYWNGTQWSKLTVQDDSENFTRSGMLEFLVPADLARRDLFGQSRYWLRAQWDKGEYSVPPHLGRVLLNTTLARQTMTLVNEIIGSSNGAERQQFASTRIPVLAGQRLEVREPEMPGVEDQAVIKDEEGDDAVSLVLDATDRPREIWVRWHEVPDFYGSGSRDRHYVIDHLTGEIRFGDGVNGRIPPVGTGNLRLARYQTGGGSKGNRAAGTVAQLKTTVPYVEKATNPEAAAGGAEAETTDALLERMPRTLRHRDRAVTLEDYEDLARLASSEVARALCVPLRDLLADPLGEVPQPGAVSVIVVPRTSEVKPLPTMELLARVGDFLAARADATASVAVVGPLYLRVDVRADVAVATPGGAGAIERAVHERLAAFLHPLTGGLEGSGWDFGRAPHRSDFFALIETVPGIDHVRYLQITETEDQPGVRRSGRFLVFSGQHEIGLVFEET
jgi:predicted phage baseplate assembly protein